MDIFPLNVKRHKRITFKNALNATLHCACTENKPTKIKCNDYDISRLTNI